MGVQLLGDQAGGGLGGVQSVQSQHRPGHLQPRQQRAGGRALAPLAGDLALSKDHPVLVADRPDQKDAPALLGPGTATGLAVQGGTGQQPAEVPPVRQPPMVWDE
ncbi:hypothetical protein OG884_26170 [Streptosporangium sp. NBC_01755]|nr:hypothetical protein [Streptosporangium sp. NBC_01755]WSC98340.1 hypothetical protein OG884_26170 [Streptosporangium sp. NBC_01755]